jgi:nucleoid DNA-binding protein
MKLFKYYTVPLILSIFLVLASCTDTFEVHEKYLKDGEVIYTNKVDSLSTFSGNKRVKIAGYISNAFNVNEIVVYWNKGQNSQTFPYAKSANATDKLELIIDNLEEQAYQFEVYSKDSDGNKSIKMTTFGSVYGETYRSNLEARAINTFSFTTVDNSATVKFKPSDELTRRTEIKYTNLGGVEVIKTLAPDVSVIVLDQLDIDRPVTYRTFYVPTLADDMKVETSIDEFASDWKTHNFPPFKSILGSTTIVPALGGIEVNWNNPTKYAINVNVGYSVGGSPKVTVIKSNVLIGTGIVSGLDNVQQTVNVTLSDTYGNSYGTRAYSVKPLLAVKLDRTLWSIIDFDSQEPGESDPSDPIYEFNGYAKAAIDGNVSTFWHSTWDPVETPFPHWFTIDMGSIKSIASFELVRRQGAGTGATVHEFEVSNDKVTWTKVGSYNGALTTNSGVSVAASANTKCRYVKYLTTVGPNLYTHLAELNMYGAE